jgi:DNA oxidative demethylase
VLLAKGMLRGSPQPKPPNAGTEAIERPGFSYLPEFISEDESRVLLSRLGQLKPCWEQRHVGERAGKGTRRLTRPVYWLGAWQFACLGYYAPPLHVVEKCVQSEPLPQVMHDILARLADALARHQVRGQENPVLNTCLVNFYGSEVVVDAKGRRVPRDYARLKMHRDVEPGPVVMFSLGQPATFEFVHPRRLQEVELALLLRHRSVVILSGAHYKDLLYHRVTRVAHGVNPLMPCVLEDFRLRRISVSFRSVPSAHVVPASELGERAWQMIEPYLQRLSPSSDYFRLQLEARKKRTEAKPGTGR